MSQAGLDPIDPAVEEEAGGGEDVGVGEGAGYRDSDSDDDSDVYADATNN